MRHTPQAPERWVKNAKSNRRGRRGQRTAWTFALLFLISTSPPARATTVVKMPFETIVAEADRIAVCEVIDMTTSLKPQTRNPVTRVTFEPVEWWKGDSQDRTVTLEFLGGPVGDGRILVVAGMPQFEEGKRYVLFWRDGDEWANPLVGWHQGQYDVIEGADGQLYVEGPETSSREIEVDRGIDLGAAIAEGNQRAVEASRPRTGGDEEVTMLENVQRALTEHLKRHGGQLKRDGKDGPSTPSG